MFAHEYSEETSRLCKETLTQNRVAVFIVSYHAESHIEQVLNRIPTWVAQMLVEVYIIDDNSSDRTVAKAAAINWPTDQAPLKVFATPYNQGYGGNQRLGYLYAISQKFDIIILLHGDGQYAPEYLPEILAEYSRPEGADAVYGSRFLKDSALRGNMPLYKYFGNRILTALQNKIIRSHLSEMHSGYRSYRVDALKKVPFSANSRGFDFDADIIIQFVAAGLTIREVSIPTFYGDEICRVDGLKYAWACIKSACQYRLMELEIFHNPKFDIPNRSRKYTIKDSSTSLHYQIRRIPIPEGKTLLDFGGGDGSAVSLIHAKNGVNVTVVDQYITVDDETGSQASAHPRLQQVAVDLDGDWTAQVGQFDVVFALDILEHLKSPERAAEQLFEVMRPGAKLHASTGNISYFVMRLIHLIGFFNYGRRGILDLTHTRLFTVSSFRRLLGNAGFQIDSIQCFGPPIADLTQNHTGWLATLDRISAGLAQAWKGLFGYQILIQATRTDSVQTIMNNTFVNLRLEYVPETGDPV